MTYNALEQECIILNAVWEMIDDMVNFAIFCDLGEKTADTNLRPQTPDALRLFNILVTDFLSPLQHNHKKILPFDLPRPPENPTPSDTTFLFYLKNICAKPNFANGQRSFETPVIAFSKWIGEKSFVEDVWFPSCQLKTNLTIERKKWIKFCGNIAKHSFPRLERNVLQIRNALKENGVNVDAGEAYEILPEFQAWFHTHLFAYHASTIAEYLNEIRWGIFEYLKPEFARSFHRTGEVKYHFEIPEMIKQPLARTMYWDLMNRCRSEPYFPRFEVTKYLKMRY
mgnify:CR=1 FL=1